MKTGIFGAAFEQSRRSAWQPLLQRAGRQEDGSRAGRWFSGPRRDAARSRRGVAWRGAAGQHARKYHLTVNRRDDGGDVEEDNHAK